MTIGIYARRAVSAVLGFATANALCLVLIGQLGRQYTLLDQFNALLSLLLPALAVALALALRLRERAIAVIAGLGLLVGCYQLGGAVLARFDARTVPADRSLKIVTLSAFHSNPDPEAIRRLMAREDPDIAVLQETNGTAAQVVDTMLPGFYRVKPCRARFCSVTILSRWPASTVKLHLPGNRARPDHVVARIDAPFGPFRVMTVHLPRPYDRNAAPALDYLGSIARAQAASPLIVAGDFNTATGSFGLNRFTARTGLHRQDGFIPTYPANLPLPAFAGIDHVFTDARWSSAGCRRTAAAGSDHYGIACTLRLDKLD